MIRALCGKLIPQARAESAERRMCHRPRSYRRCRLPDYPEWRNGANQRRQFSGPLKTLAETPLQLSILLPTNRHGPVTTSKIAQACWRGPARKSRSWCATIPAMPDKRALLPHFQREHCEIISVDPCEPLRIIRSFCAWPKASLYFCMSDDDQCIDRAILALPEVIERSGGDPTVAAVTGAYALESPQGTSVFAYTGRRLG